MEARDGHCGCSGGGRDPVTGRFERYSRSSDRRRQPDGMCPPEQQQPAEAHRLRQQGRPLGPHGQVPADRGRQSGHRRSPVPQFGGARLQGLGRLRGRRHESSGLRRDVAGVQVRLLQLRRGPDDAGGVADAAFVWAGHGVQPWNSRRFDEREAPTRGRHCRACDAYTQLGQRLLSLRLRRVRAGQHRPDPAGHMHVSPEGGERRGRRCLRRRHLQRGQPRTNRPLQRGPLR